MKANIRMVMIAAGIVLGLAAGAGAESVLEFTGSGSYVALGTPGALHMAADAPFTIEGWMKLKSTSVTDMLYSRRASRGSGNYTYMFGTGNGNTMRAYIGHGGSPNTTWRDVTLDPALETDRWYHLAFSFDGADLVYYLDGVAVGTNEFRYSDHANYHVMIGGYSDASDINGFKSDVRVWDHARGQNDIQVFMHRRLFGDESGLLGYWPLNEGEGSNVFDGTANASDGTLVSATWTTTDLKFQPSIAMFDLETGNDLFTNSNTVSVAFNGTLADFDRYQFTETDTQPTAGWQVFDPTNPPPTTTFTVPDPEGPVTLYCWFTNSTQTIEAAVASNTITYVRESATVTAQAGDITRTLFGTNNAVIFTDMIDIGSTSDPLDILRVSLFFDEDLTPELHDRVTIANPQSDNNDYAVTLEVMDLAGNRDRAEATVTLLWIEDGYGNYVWNGAGVSGGTEDPRWLLGDNWLVGGIVPASPPGLADDASITLNEAFDNPELPNAAVVVGTGATARNVSFNAMNTDGRRVEFQGDTSFSTLDYTTARNTINIVAGTTLTLTGGEINPATDAVIRATFMFGHALADIYDFANVDGIIRCTGDQVAISVSRGAWGGDIYIDDPQATIHFRNSAFGVSGDFYVYDTQRIIGLNTSRGIYPTRYSGDLYSRNGNALTNWFNCHIGGMGYTMSSGAPFTLPAGTYGSVFVGYRGHYAGNIWYDISGDVTFAGENVRGYAVEVQRRRLTNPNGARFGLNGHNLTVTGGGLIQICEFTDPDPENHNTDPIWWNRIEAEGSTVTTDGDIAIGPGGYFTGDGETVIRLAGHWDNRSQWQSDAFTLENSTLVLNGAASSHAPQWLEAQSEDMGPSLDGMINNHAIGGLEIGTPEQPTYARLIDIDDFKEDGLADAFYVGELIVHAGSILDIHGLELYVNGQTVRGRWLDFGDGLVTDSTIPSGTLIMLR